MKDELDKAEFRKRGYAVKQKAASHYWTAIEQHVPRLLDIVKDPSLLDPTSAGKEDWSGTPWGRILARSAREAYDLACPRETARQLKAYSLGLRELFRPVETVNGKDDNEEEEV
jgi:hypothetical protein